MEKRRKTRALVGFIGVSALLFGGCQANSAPNHRYKTNHFAAAKAPPAGYYTPQKLRQRPKTRRAQPQRSPQAGSNNRYGISPSQSNHREKSSWLDRINGNRPSKHPSMMMPQFQQWVEYEPVYQLYPGDQIDIVVASAPELSRNLTIGPDGRIVMPMTQPIMAAGKTMMQVQGELQAQLGKQLRDPSISVTPRAYGPQQFYVGGEVGAPGTYTLPGPIGALEALFMAGGLRDSAKTNRIAVMRRAPNGGMMMRTVNIGHGLKQMPHYNDVIQLRRGDIIFVPKTRLSEIGLFVQSVRSVLPVDFNLSYQFGSNNGGTTVISP